MNINNNQIVNINNRWSNQIGGIYNWNTRYPARAARWNNWGNGVRNNWWHHNYHDHWFDNTWWSRHSYNWGGWHYGYSLGSYPANYWWGVPTFASLTSWFNWQAPATTWSQPVYYDYGQGGNVYYDNSTVYINGEQIASADEFAQSAMQLATVEAPPSEEQAAESEWMPLGTFAVSTAEDDANPIRVCQLAINRDGVVSGTLYNNQTDQAFTIQGRVDEETQRVAVRVGESENIVVETGLYNLTQDEAPVLVHYGPGDVENWLLVRLDYPEDQEDPGSL
ncbi:hypothetical protein AB1L42_02580 [Thalassoglobus sp. JC818]|uniref:hypothetical protein n=1 Tax=Thalassoglobus sp. JC818 TaxID=3232136 RepID=UPI003459EFC3